MTTWKFMATVDTTPTTSSTTSTWMMEHTNPEGVTGELGEGLAGAVVSGLQHVRSGKLHAIATTTKKRIPLLPGTPTASETLPGLEIDNWYGMVAPAGTPPNTLNQLQRAIAQALSTTTIQEKLSSQGMEPVGGTPQAFDVFLKAEIIKWGRVVKSANIRPE